MKAPSTHALREGGDERAVAEARGPRSVRCSASRKRNSNATPRKISASSIDQDREIDRRDDDGEGERERREQADAAQHQPGLVAVPDRRDRVHHQVARGVVGREAETGCRRRDRSRRAART